MLNYVILAVVGYVIGSIPMSYIVGSKIGKIDIREYGSGNPGATNVFRTLGKKAGFLALAGDFLKGVVAVLAGRYVMGDTGALFCGLMSVIGHCFPFTIGFKGGKGVATSAGMLLAVNPLIFFVLMIVQFTVGAATRYMSLASIAAAVCFPIVAALLKMDPVFIGFSVIFSALVVQRHSENIKRLLNGTEKRMTFGKKKD